MKGVYDWLFPAQEYVLVLSYCKIGQEPLLKLRGLRKKGKPGHRVFPIEYCSLMSNGKLAATDFYFMVRPSEIKNLKCGEFECTCDVSFQPPFSPKIEMSVIATSPKMGGGPFDGFNYTCFQRYLSDVQKGERLKQTYTGHDENPKVKVRYE